MISEPFYYFLYIRDAETEMAVFVVCGNSGSALDKMQMTVIGDFKPGMPAIVKGLGYRIDLYNIVIECRAFLQVLYVNSNMVQHGFLGMQRI